MFLAPLPFRYKVTFTGCEAAILSAAEDRQTTKQFFQEPPLRTVLLKSLPGVEGQWMSRD